MALDSKGNLFVVQFAQQGGEGRSKTLEIREYTLPDPASRPRRLTITSDDTICTPTIRADTWAISTGDGQGERITRLRAAQVRALCISAINESSGTASPRRSRTPWCASIQDAEVPELGDSRRR